MSRPTTLLKDGTLVWVIRLYDEEGELLDADSTPTVAVRKNGSSVGDSVTVTKRSATTGIYDCSYNPASEVEGDQFSMEESATIGGTAYQNSWEFSVKVAEGSVTDWNGITNATSTVNLTGTTVAGIVGGGTGARTVTATVQTSGAVAIQGAKIRLTKGAESFVQVTNASGVATFNVDDGTWTVAITASGYTFSGTTLVVDGTETATYTMTDANVSAPANPSLSTGYVYCYDANGDAEEDVEIVAYQTTGPGDDGYAYDAAEFTMTSDSNGLAQHAFVREAVYKVRRGTGKEVTVTVPNSGTFALPEMLGQSTG